MRILVHDYSGHPFQVQLSRELARRGHEVWHLTSADFQSPKARLEDDGSLGDRLTIRNLSLGETFHKDAFIQRRSQEINFGKLIGSEISRIRPEVVLSSNAPLDTQRWIMASARRVGARFVFWVQDLYGEAIYRILKRRLGFLGQVVGLYYQRLEYSMLRASDAAVVISPDFVPMLTRRGVSDDKIKVIENWAPLEETPYIPPQARADGDPINVIYSGTLGYKHNPELLVECARLANVEVRIYSEGRVAEAIKAQASGLASLHVLGWVPSDSLAETLASGDILVAMIEADAGVFSVPSKILTYLCAGRPIVASIPPSNLGARTIERASAGLISVPGDVAGFLANIVTLATNQELRTAMGRRGRAYAVDKFPIGRIADDFEATLRGEKAQRGSHAEQASSPARSRRGE